MCRADGRDSGLASLSRVPAPRCHSLLLLLVLSLQTPGSHGEEPQKTWSAPTSLASAVESQVGSALLLFTEDGAVSHLNNRQAIPLRGNYLTVFPQTCLSASAFERERAQRRWERGPRDRMTSSVVYVSRSRAPTPSRPRHPPFRPPRRRDLL